MAPAILHLSVPVRDLDEARTFYENVLGCSTGRVRSDWIDIWFFGMQVTLQLRPEEARPVAEQGSRHFGVALGDEASYHRLVDRLMTHDVTWVSEPTTHAGPDLSGKANVKVADPSGNIIEVKYYADDASIRPEHTLHAL